MAELWPIMSEQIGKNSVFFVIFLIWIKFTLKATTGYRSISGPNAKWANFLLDCLLLNYTMLPQILAPKTYLSSN